MRTLAVLASGQGTNFEALAHASRRGSLGGHIAVLVTDRPDAPALDRARRLGIETLTLPTGSFRTRLADESAWVAALQERKVECVLLAGFMRRLHETFLSAFPDRVINVHPSLLPAFPGLDAIRQALDHGARVTGVTVHLVDDELDAGPILAQAPVPIEEDDTYATLAARVHEVEHELYPQTVRRFLTEPWRREGRRITFHVPTAGGTRG
jgi:phosphoribosylglycinamide formyltransferase-1